MVLRALPDANPSLGGYPSVAEPEVIPDERSEPRSFDLASYAKELEVALHSAREELRAAVSNVASIRNGVDLRARRVVDLEARLVAAENAAVANAAEREELGARLEIAENIAGDRDALAQTMMALRDLYAVARADGSAAAGEAGSLRTELGIVRATLESETARADRAAASVEVAHATLSAERDALNAAMTRVATEAQTEYAALHARYLLLVEEMVTMTEAIAHSTASEIDAIRASRIWRVRGFFARLFGRGGGATSGSRDAEPSEPHTGTP
jgi:chromosome segregation ATPase